MQLACDPGPFLDQGGRGRRHRCDLDIDRPLQIRPCPALVHAEAESRHPHEDEDAPVEDDVADRTLLRNQHNSRQQRQRRQGGTVERRAAPALPGDRIKRYSDRNELPVEQHVRLTERVRQRKGE